MPRKPGKKNRKSSRKKKAADRSSRAGKSPDPVLVARETALLKRLDSMEALSQDPEVIASLAPLGIPDGASAAFALAEITSTALSRIGVTPVTMIQRLGDILLNSRSPSASIAAFKTIQEHYRTQLEISGVLSTQRTRRKRMTLTPDGWAEETVSVKQTGLTQPLRYNALKEAVTQNTRDVLGNMNLILDTEPESQNRNGNGNTGNGNLDTGDMSNDSNTYKPTFTLTSAPRRRTRYPAGSELQYSSSRPSRRRRDRDPTGPDGRPSSGPGRNPWDAGGSATIGAPPGSIPTPNGTSPDTSGGQPIRAQSDRDPFGDSGPPGPNPEVAGVYGEHAESGGAWFGHKPPSTRSIAGGLCSVEFGRKD